MDEVSEVMTKIQEAINATVGTANWISPLDCASDPPLLKKPDCIGSISHLVSFFGIYE